MKRKSGLSSTPCSPQPNIRHGNAVDFTTTINRYHAQGARPVILPKTSHEKIGWG